MSDGTTAPPTHAGQPASAVDASGRWRFLLASNRGPIAYRRDDDGTLRRTHQRLGGLDSGLADLSASADALWVCSSMTDSDRAAARSSPDGRLDLQGPGDQRIRMLDIEAITFSRAHDAVANSVLWNVHHLLCDPARSPLFGARFRHEWAAFVDYNHAFADALAEDAAPDARVISCDYHLTLTPQLLRERRPDLRIAHVSHTPWAPPDYFRMLPDDVAVAVLEGMLAADHVAFLAPRWARAFVDCCANVLGASVDEDARNVEYAGRRTAIGVHPLGVDAEELRERGRQSDVRARMTWLRGMVGGRRLVVRVDRAELSHNTVRGLAAYREFLRNHPEWHGRVVHLAIAYPSNRDLPEYHEYTAQLQRIAKKIMDEFGSPDWDPLVLTVEDDFARSLAAYRMADVALVTPVRDGMSLVAKEIPVLSDEGCALVLSREAGAAAELGGDAFVVNPYDVESTAQALHDALAMPLEERSKSSAALAGIASAHPPAQWLRELLACLPGAQDGPTV